MMHRMEHKSQITGDLPRDKMGPTDIELLPPPRSVQSVLTNTHTDCPTPHTWMRVFISMK